MNVCCLILAYARLIMQPSPGQAGLVMFVTDRIVTAQTVSIGL
jgi:hypothetical protein